MLLLQTFVAGIPDMYGMTVGVHALQLVKIPPQIVRKNVSRDVNVLLSDPS